MAYLFSALIGYLLGSLNLSDRICRARRVDLRKQGTGNPGVSNSVLLFGWETGLVVLIHDVGKAVLAIWLCRRLFPTAPLCREVAGVACVLGHMYPFYLHFHGGKGVAAYLGMVASLNWRFCLILLAAVALLILLTDKGMVGMVSGVSSYPLYCLFTRHFFSAAIVLVAASMILFRHRVNFVRMRSGTEIGVRSGLRGDHVVRDDPDGLD